MQRENVELLEALQIEAPKQYFNDPLRLQVPYDYLAARLVKPPDCVVARVIAIMAIGALFAYPLIQGAAYLVYLRTYRLFSPEQPPPNSECQQGQPWTRWTPPPQGRYRPYQWQVTP